MPSRVFVRFRGAFTDFQNAPFITCASLFGKAAVHTVDLPYSDVLHTQLL